MKDLTYNRVAKSLIRYGVFAFILALTACNPSQQRMDSESISLNLPADIYELSQSQFHSSEMKMGSMQMQDFREVVRANGMFDVPPENRVAVSVYFGGYIKEIKLLPGQRVSKGQALFTLENPEYVQVQQEFLEARSQLDFLKSDYDRQKNLVADNVTSQKIFLKAEADYNATRVKYESLWKKLELMNMNPKEITIENIQTQIIIHAPISGYITELNVTKGAFLNPADVAMMIVNTDHLHLELKIFEQDITKVHIGQPIQFTIQDDHHSSYEAKVHLVNRSVDPDTRTIDIHAHLDDNQLNDKFNPGMYVEAEIYTVTDSKFSLPEDALVEIDNKFYVLTKKSFSNDGYFFMRKEVELGRSNDGYSEILNAEVFPEGTEFLIAGAYNLIEE